MDLNVILIVLGVLALVILVAHGLWANRREKTQFFKNANTFTRDGRIEHPNFQQANQFNQAQSQNDPLMNTAPSAAQPQTPQSKPQAQTTQTQTTETRQTAQAQAPVQQGLNFDTPAQSVSVAQDVSQIKITLPNDESSAPQETPSYEKTSASAGVQIRSTPSVKLQDDGHLAARSQPAVEEAAVQPAQEVRSRAQQDVYVQTRPQAEPAPQPKPAKRQTHLVLYVVAPEGREFQGPVLVQTLDDLGLIYSEQGIYHRYFDTVASPILFSVANIRQPGTFDLGNIDGFHTVGVALFMQLSGSVKNDLLNFRSMELDARRLAEQLGGFVLDEQQEIFTEQSKAEYNAKIQA